MLRKDEAKPGRRGFNPFNVGYTPRAPENFQPVSPGSHLPKAPPGAGTGELPVWERKGYVQR
jgi:hypothetical protein